MQADITVCILTMLAFDEFFSWKLLYDIRFGWIVTVWYV
jgi:hypothetical protein